MKSSTGAYFIGLDHVRALAAFMVFAWHFTHSTPDTKGYPVPFEGAPAIFPLSVFGEGHTGVALFMTLSGYLFAKLLDGRSVVWRAFLWNRVLRLLPLLLLVLAYSVLLQWRAGADVGAHLVTLVEGVVLPTLPNGAWSITAEFHFYLFLPFLLFAMRRRPGHLVLFVLAAMLFRAALLGLNGQVQMPSYFTIVGRIDQFVAGMLAWQWRDRIANRHWLAAAVLLAFCAFYSWFDHMGGFYGNLADPSASAVWVPSTNPVWVFLPTVEAIAYGVGVAWYDGSFAHSPGPVSRFIARLGEYSYSIYLVHVFVVFRLARFVHEHVMDISNFHLALLWSIGGFALMAIPGYLSFRFIESPFLKFRRPYFRKAG